MLPSRLFRNVGIPASLYRQSPTPVISLRFTPRAAAAFGLGRQNTPPPSRPYSSAVASSGTPEAPVAQQQEPRLRITFTCTAPASTSTPDVQCSHRSTHEFTKRAYTTGIVLVQCPECKNRHLIADNIGWFKESTKDGKYPTVEDLLRSKGEKVRRGQVADGETVEYVE